MKLINAIADDFQRSGFKESGALSLVQLKQIVFFHQERFEFIPPFQELSLIGMSDEPFGTY